jgi:hypothetical protein
MPFLAKVVAFWIVVCAAIWLLKRIPDSLPARIAFARLGPSPLRGELRSLYLRRWAGCAGTWFAQALSILAAGWIALRWNTMLAESTSFLAFWAIVVPVLGGVAGVSALSALIASLWLRRFGPDPPCPFPAHAVHA